MKLPAGRCGYERAASVLRVAQAAGVTITVDGGDLVVRAQAAHLLTC
jgi:hypothetical protein